MKKNLLFFIADALSQYDIDFIIKNKKYFKGFWEILKNSTVYKNVFSVAPVTEMALPTIFSGDLPFSNGSYENGIKSKKNNIFSMLHKNKYEVEVLSGSFWMSDIYGYKVEGTKIENLYSIEGAWKGFQRAYVFHWLNNINFLSKEYYKKILLRNYSFYNNFIEQDNSYFTKTISKISSKEKKIIKKNISYHIKLIRKDPKEYLIKYGNDIVKKSFFEFFYEIKLNRKILKLLEKIFFKHKSIIPNIKISNISEVRTPSQKFLFNKFYEHIIKFLNNKSKKKYKACIIHFFDIHDKNYSDNEIYKTIDLDKEFINTILPLHRDKKKLLSLKYIDNYLIKLFKTQSNILKNYTLVLTSDHGVTFRNKESAFNSTALSGSFHDDYLHIPLVINNKSKISFQKRLMSSTEILNEIADYLGLYKKTNFKKKNKIKKNILVSEHCFRGPYSLNRKKKILYFCVRSSKMKYIEKINSHDNDPNPKQKNILINLMNDKSESKNIYKNVSKKYLSTFKKIIKQRVSSI